MLSVPDAVAAILAQVQAGPSEARRLPECLARVLAEDLSAPHDSPPFDKAQMDGFAVRVGAVDHSNPNAALATITLPIAETITAGRIPAVAIHEGIASRIMTGAILPHGCNCVVPIERTQFDEQRPDSVTIAKSEMSPEANIMRQGTAAKTGSTLLRAGIRIQPQHIAAMAEFGIGTVPVVRQPHVAVLATGNELMEVEQSLEPGRIRNSNEPMLVAQVSASGAVPVPLGIARDNESELRASIERGLQNDVFLLTGGVSAGLLDLVPAQLGEAGVQQIFHGVHMKPGKPLWFGMREHGNRRCLVFGLPGNPVSSLVCFELFVRPAIQMLSGIKPGASPANAILTDTISVKGNRPVYQPVAVSISYGRLVARPVKWSSSSDLRATVEANGMALLHSKHGAYAAGDIVEIWLWGDQRLV